MAENPDDVLHVEGGKPLNGTIKVRGAKNFVSKAMVAALLAPGKSVLKNVTCMWCPICYVCTAWTWMWTVRTAL